MCMVWYVYGLDMILIRGYMNCLSMCLFIISGMGHGFKVCLGGCSVGYIDLNYGVLFI